jgi:BirA family transcriptional regulator, biotin operon repressor / biotin---[acetyl-CoA-carboxylase] ligase
MPLRSKKVPWHDAGTQALEKLRNLQNHMQKAEKSLQWSAQALWQQLEPLLPRLSVEVVHRTVSTNTALLERARAVPDSRNMQAHPETGQAFVKRSIESGAFGRRSIDLQPCLLVAEHQSGGRGRHGRAWQSNAGASLTFSLGLPLGMKDWSGLSLAVGVILCEAFDNVATEPDKPAVHMGLKWPNDLWLTNSAMDTPGTGRKLGGVLIETVSAGEQRLAIIGIGLNVLPFDTHELNTGFASLREIAPTLTAPQALARVALPLVQGLKLFEREGFAAFAERFAARDVLNGHKVCTTHPDLPEGLACGVSAQGELLVQTNTGRITHLASGEVSVRIAPPPGH